MNSSVPKFSDVVPYLCRGHLDPISISRTFEEAHYYYGPGSSSLRALSMSEVNERMKKHGRGSISRGHGLFPVILNGMPMRNVKRSPVDSFQSIRGRKIQIDPFTNDPQTLKRAQTAKMSFNAFIKHLHLLKTCQHRDHERINGKRATVHYRVPMCSPCAGKYRFMRPAAASDYLPIARIFRAPKFGGAILKHARLEVFIGWLCLCASETSGNMLSRDMPTKELEELGVIVSLHFYAFKYPARYSCIRMFDPCRPERASWLNDHRHVFASKAASLSTRLWWRSVEERGFIRRSGQQSLPCASNLSSAVGSQFTEHVRFVWNSKFMYSMSFLELSAGVSGVHPRFRVVVHSKLVPPSAELAEACGFPDVRRFDSETAHVTICEAQSKSFAFALRCVHRAADAVEGRRQKTATLELDIPVIHLCIECSPLHAARGRPRTSALKVAFSAGIEQLVPLPTTAFSVWALHEASVQDNVSVGSGLYSVASMYPFNEADLIALKERIESGDKWPLLPDIDVDDVQDVLHKLYIEGAAANDDAPGLGGAQLNISRLL